VKHGSLSWHIKTLEAFQIKGLKKILCVTWQDAVHHTEVLKWAGSGSMQSTLNNHQLRWLGHVICVLEGRHLPKVLNGHMKANALLVARRNGCRNE
jgi:hypothetical protein